MVSRLRDLDIYGNDLADRAYVLEPAPASPLEPLVSPARQAVGSAVDTAAITAAWQRGQAAAATGSAHSWETWERVRADPSLVARAALVGLCGLGGVVAGYRGGGLRRLAYGALGLTAGAGLCYPAELADASVRGFDFVRERSTGGK
ncbi:hypothetical protein BOX15_Mlig008243g2 [Macrostomum lignano]|uniref:Uncharacterized protein n=1 Tax=Macrostomum lignano TaxID=282301 RepID=A0A267H8C4_9PLAT|nr:hypothetical protein BOX15_Mlig008243g2 [Macrostomum lignano]